MTGEHPPRRERVSSLGIQICLVLASIATGAAALAAFSGRSHAQPPTDRAERIDEYVRQQMESSRIPGVAIAVVDRDRVVQATGLGEDGSGRSITPRTPFWIGSLTKSFTALSVMQLVEAGRVNLDEPVQRSLPDFRLADEQAASAITVRQLLNHTSGLSRSDGLRPLLEEREQALEEAVADLKTMTLNRPVGESLEYSNLNYVVLGLLVQRVSGRSWVEYVENEILAPLGMAATYTSFREAREHGMTELHRFWFGYPVPKDPPYLEGLAPTGYLVASAEDMARYLSMYLNGGELGGRRVLSAAGITEMLTPTTNETATPLLSTAFERSYAMGWFAGPFGMAEDARWHLGAMPYLNAWVVLLPDTEQAVVVLINAGSQMEFVGANEVMARLPLGIVNILRDGEPPTGLGLARFYLIFDGLVAALLGVQLWSLWRMLRPAQPRQRNDVLSVTGAALMGGPLIWELGLGLSLMVGYPWVVGLGWSASMLSTPDLTVVLLTISTLWLTTGAARLLRIILLSRPSPTASESQELLAGELRT